MRITKENNISLILLGLYVISLFVTANSIITFDSKLNFQLHHIIFAVIFFLFIGNQIKKKEKTYIPALFLLFFLYLVLCSLANYSRFGIGNMFVSSIYSFLVIVVFSNYFIEFDETEIIASIGKAVKIVYIMIIINIILQLNSIIEFISGSYTHPRINSLVGGGVNLEASLLALFSIFLLRERYGIVYCIISLIISALYASRTAILINVLLFIYYLFIVKNTSVKKIIVPSAVIALLFIVVANTTAGQITIQRFLNIGNEGGSVARLKIWNDTFTVIKNNIFGVGCGNVMKAIEIECGVVYGENNTHNIFLQFFCDEGIIGLLFIIIGSIWIFLNEIKIGFKNVFGAFMLLVIFQGMFQSRGIDAWMAAPLGLYFMVLRRRKSNDVLLNITSKYGRNNYTSEKNPVFF